MALLKCDLCSGGLIMDKSGKFAACEFCGTKYTKETLQMKIENAALNIKNYAEIDRQKLERVYYLRRADGVCLHCGSKFKGLFNKVCSNCGRPKDYE